MPQTLFEHFMALDPKPTKWQNVIELFTHKEYKKETFLCKRNEFPEKVYFVTSGYIRGFFTNTKGYEYNKLLFTDNHIAASVTALANKTESRIELQCLTDCVVYEANFHDLMELVYEDKELSELYIATQHYLYKHLEESELDKVLLTAKERYLKLLNDFPDIEDKIMLYHIASHLGITPIQLSRIRKSLSVPEGQ